MSNEEISLPIELEKLEIVSGRMCPTLNGDENPFQRKSPTLRGGATRARCGCAGNRRLRNVSFKRGNGKLLKEPVLRYVNLCCQNANNENKSKFTKEQNDFRDLVSECDHLQLSGGGSFEAPSFRSVQNQTATPSSSTSFTSSGPRSRPESCSQQVLNPPCDVTIDELASYFETLVHIPKKMSSMAEMMYT